MMGRDILPGWSGSAVDLAETEPVEQNGIEVGRADEESLERWDDHADRTPHWTPFHRLDALRTQAGYSDTTLVPLVGYKGQEVVGLFPVFVWSTAGITVASSPAPDLWISSLGPAVVRGGGIKQRRAEARHRRFVDGAVEWLRQTCDPNYVHVSSARRYDDPRPFEWNDFSVSPRYSYVVDLTRGPDELLSAFSSDARRNVTDESLDYEITVAGPEVIRRTIEEVRRRYEQQGESYAVSTEFVVDLYDRLPDGTVRPYACWSDGRFVGGMVVLADGDTVYRWQGGAKTDHELPVNDLLDWRIIRDAAADGYARYDLDGANEPRLCEYKAKFAPEVETYYRLERGPPWIRLGSRIYTGLIR
jgi:hypothetical protein